jgi:hypothetical protein
MHMSQHEENSLKKTIFILRMSVILRRSNFFNMFLFALFIKDIKRVESWELAHITHYILL